MATVDNANQTGRLIGSNVVLLILSTAFVALRLASRKLSKAGFWWDDAVIVLALIVSYGLPICNLTALQYGHGQHLSALKDIPEDVQKWQEIFYIFEMFYIISVSVVKFSILLFYQRIFPVAEFKRPLIITGLVVVAFMISVFFAYMFQCTPIRYFWMAPLINGHCVNLDKMFLATGSINVVLDFIILALPIPVLWRLRTTRSQITILTGIFTVATFVCLVSIIRLVVLSRLSSSDKTWTYVNAAIWTATEVSMGVVSACIPSLRPLVTLIISGSPRGPTLDHTGTSTSSTTIHSKPAAWRTSRINSDAVDGDFIRLKGSSDSDTVWGHNVSVQGGVDRTMEVPIDGIQVKTEITLTSSKIDYHDRLY